jgi:hypothetical protein
MPPLLLRLKVSFSYQSSLFGFLYRRSKSNLAANRLNAEKPRFLGSRAPQSEGMDGFVD